MTIRELGCWSEPEHILAGYLKALDALSPTDLNFKKWEDKQFLFSILNQRKIKGVHSFVAINGTDVLGTASVFLEPKVIHHGGIAAHIEDVAVIKPKQKMGIGKSLVRHIIEFCSTKRVYKILLACNDDVMAFYEKFGFKRSANTMRLNLNNEFI